MYIQGSKMRVYELKRAPRLDKRRNSRRDKSKRIIASHIVAYHAENIHLPAVVRVQPVKTANVGTQTDPIKLPELARGLADSVSSDDEKGRSKVPTPEREYVNRMFKDKGFDGGFY